MAIMVDEDTLSAVLSEFACTLVNGFSIQAILHHLAHRIVEVLPITSAGVTLFSVGMSRRYTAACVASSCNPMR